MVPRQAAPEVAVSASPVVNFRSPPVRVAVHRDGLTVAHIALN